MSNLTLNNKVSNSGDSNLKPILLFKNNNSKEKELNLKNKNSTLTFNNKVFKPSSKILKSDSIIMNNNNSNEKKPKIQKIDINQQIEEEIKLGNTYDIALLDIPWFYGNKNGKKFYGTANFHYPTMKDKEISKMKLEKILNKNSIVLLWVTSPKLFSAFKISQDWGLKYVCRLFTWKKLQPNSLHCATTCGNYSRCVVEDLLMFKNKNSISSKKFVREQTKIITNLIETYEKTVFIEACRREHSRKPELSYELLDKIFFNVKKIELFSRQSRLNWKTLGNEVNKFGNSSEIKQVKLIRKILEENSNLIEQFNSFEEVNKNCREDKNKKLYKIGEKFSNEKIIIKEKNIKFPTILQFLKKRKLEIQNMKKIKKSN